MPLYQYRCAKGHGALLWAGMNDKKPKSLRCAEKGCWRRAKRVWEAPQITADVPEHFNVSIGQPVRSRRHLADLQRRSQDTDRPFTDYQPVKKRDDMAEAAYKASKRPRAKRMPLSKEAEKVFAESESRS